MGNYSLHNIFTKEPAVIAEALRLILFMAVLLEAVVLNEKQLAAIGIAAGALLTLFVRQTSTANANLPK